jgi:hypothetical protein
MQAQATPLGAILAFADDGSKPFGKYEDDCQVRMQRVGVVCALVEHDHSGAAIRLRLAGRGDPRA